MNHLRVLFVSDKVDVVGGGEISLLHLIGGLQSGEGFEPYLAVPASGELSDRAEALGIPVVILPQPRVKTRPWSLPRHWKRAKQVIADIGPDIVHVNSARSMLIAGVAGDRCHLPVIWHVRVEGRDIFDRWLASRCTRIITPTRVVASRYPSATVHVIPNPVTLPEAGVTEQAIQQLREGFRKDDEFLLLAVGELVRRKGHLRLLEALSQLDAALPWRLLICGRQSTREPGFRKELDDFLEEKRLTGRVHLLGFREDVPELMLASDLLIHAPDSEGFGRVFIEAMATGLPLVVTPAGGLAELHEDTGLGWISEDMTAEALAATVERVLGDREGREAFRSIAPGMAAERYSVEQHAARVRELYLEPLDRDGPVNGRPA